MPEDGFEKPAWGAPMLADLERMTGHGHSDDGLVQVTIDGAAVPTRLVIESAAMRQAPSTLSASIVAALQMAHEDLRDQVGRRLSATGVDDHFGASAADGDIFRTAADLSRATEDVVRQLDLTRRRLFDALDDR